MDSRVSVHSICLADHLFITATVSLLQFTAIDRFHFTDNHAVIRYVIVVLVDNHSSSSQLYTMKSYTSTHFVNRSLLFQ